jgi:hypothetical protein
MGKTHIWNEGGIKPGDLIKIVDELTPEERLQIAEIRKLGNSAVLSSKADVLEALAKAARGHAEASEILDAKPYLFPDAAPPQTEWALWTVVLNVIVLCAVVAMATQFYRVTKASIPPTLPASAATEVAPAPPEAPKAPRSTEKGRAARGRVADINSIANVY